VRRFLFLFDKGTRSRRQELAEMKIELILRSEPFFSQQTTDPITMIIICTGIGC
jgi:hypothetical protein